MAPSVKFVFFDLGNVLLFFDNERRDRQLAEAAGVSVDQVKTVLEDGRWQADLECGRIEPAAAYEAFRQATGSSVADEQLRVALSDIFTLNGAIVSLVARLKMANVRLGILSDTSAPHWSWATDGRYTILPDYFQKFALSFEIGSCKPGPEIYVAATELAGVAPQEIFFTDDRLPNVEGARAAGWQAVPFQSPLQLSRDLIAAGVRFNGG